jgi:guanidinopropionase
VGDVAINALDLSASLATTEAFFRRVDDMGAMPISVGGDHHNG